MQVGARVELDDFEALRRDTAAKILDVRNPGEVEQGAIPGSLRITLAELSQRHAEVPAGPVLIHCASGWRSSVAASALRNLGHSDVTDLIGGYNAWAAQYAVKA